MDTIESAGGRRVESGRGKTRAIACQRPHVWPISGSWWVDTIESAGGRRVESGRGKTRAKKLLKAEKLLLY